MEASSRSVSLNDFTLLRVLGRGTYGKVLLVKETCSGKLYALKVLKKDNIVQLQQVEHTKTERRILELARHPFIVKLKYAFQTSTKLFFVLEYCPGGELFYHLSRSRRFSEPVVVFYSACLVLAIEHLHANDIVYRDLKPENTLIDKDGYLKLADFGLSKTDLSLSDRCHTLCGSQEYLAPEVLLNRGYGQEVDWWSLGVITYEMLTGLPTFYSENVEQMFRDIVKKQPVFPPYISPEAKSLLQQLLQKDPTLRLGHRGTQEIKDHPFFAGLDWKALFAKTLKTPFVPSQSDGETAKFFDEETLSQSEADTSEAQSADSSGSTFRNFTYYGTPDSAHPEETPFTPESGARTDHPPTPQTA